jgi:hypothetical protein
MKKTWLFSLVLLFILGACTTAEYSVNESGYTDHVTVVVKDFRTLGFVTVVATETHTSGPMGFSRRVEGSNITYEALLKEAAKLQADDIVNVKVDVACSYTKTAFDWLIGWTRVYTYTGTALAIRYADKQVEISMPDAHLSGLPKEAEESSASKSVKLYRPKD